MDMTTFRLIVIRWAIAGIVVMTICFSGCVAQEDYWISQDIKGGANPIAANCAHAVSSDKQICQTIASR